MAELHIKGLEPLQRLLDTLPAKLEQNVMRGALREGAKVLLTEATYRAPARSGALVASLRVGTRTRGGTVTSYVKTDRWYARLVEYGTKPHEIKPKRAKSLFVAGWFGMVVQHPGAKPHPFMRPALDAGAQSAVIAAAEYMKKRLQNKESINTSHVMIDGDE